ncbi:BapA/Bap/LapF family prefix-like domain-containing protein [Algicella marina]|uniref:Haemolysin-type calcium binding-related domain-containing protein n=1 Tax=Algicella marina TaxID=2683284 RepID=A0A6P1SZB3_9RHOB|nr:calcium-binding protein [Algicella marina]QHQ35808.1 hypothetical protein GO499_11805 [Algicella marina]
MSGLISSYNPFGPFTAGIDNIRGVTANLLDGVTDGGHPAGLLSEVIENSSSLSDSVDGRLDSLEWLPGDIPSNDSLYRDIHNDVLDALNSPDPATQAEAQAIQDWLDDNGLWDDGYADWWEDQNDPDNGDDPEDSPTDDESPEGDRVDPLVIDLDGDGIELSSVENSTANFDLDGNGFAERTGWVDADDGILVRDIDADGNIRDISELFGDTDGHVDGFSNLSSFDENADGVIDASDAIFAELQIWRDLDQDGVSDSGELFSMSAIGITAISLSTTALNSTIAGNEVPLGSTVTFDDGSTSTMVDVFFSRNPFDSNVVLDPEFEASVEAQLLPQLFGSGAVASTTVALTLDPSLATDAQAMLTMLEEGRIDDYHAAFEDFLIDWAGAGSASETGRGPHVNGQKLATLEAFFDQGFVQLVGSTPMSDPQNAATGAQMDELFDTYRDWLSIRFIAQAAMSSVALTVTDTTTDQDIADAFAAHPLSGLAFLVDGYSERDFRTSGSMESVLEGLEAAVTTEVVSPAGAASIAHLLEYDYRNSGQTFDALLRSSAESAGLAEDSLFFAELIYSGTHQILEGTESGDTLALTSGSGYFLGRGGDDTLSNTGGNNVFFGGEGDDTLISGDGSDHYHYALGDGSDLIRDYDPSSNSGSDTLTFSDIASTDVTMVQSSYDLVITTSTGETITIDNYFDTDQDYAIESIVFSDGVTLSWQDVRDRSVADQVALGHATIYGTELQENYVHTSGDGSYVINDYDFSSNTANDTLTFADQASTDVTMVQSSYDLVITTSTGETVTIDNYFDTDQDYAIESIVFSDGVTLSWQDVRDRSVADQVALGHATIYGTELQENYVHTSGDGSYVINDYDFSSNSATDTLTFADQASTDVTMVQSSYDLVITTSTGETVTIDNYFDTDADFHIEQIAFSDGVTLSWQNVRDRSVADQVAAGQAIIFGTELEENYVHTSGDGSYMIRDYDFSSNTANDRLTFSDIASTDVTMVQNSYDLVITTSGGETITIDNYFDTDQDYNIEYLTFSDGISMGWQNVRDRSVADQVAEGYAVVEGTELRENYVHTSGDGSYIIRDYDYSSNTATDTLTFTDQASTDVTMVQNAYDLVITTSTGETITIDNYFDTDQDYNIEELVFTDGVTLNWQNVRDRSVADQVAEGYAVVEGTELRENYVHTSGDGSYIIRDYDYSSNTATDTLTFTDQASTDVTMVQNAYDLVITTSTGETITIDNYFDTDQDYNIEELVFTDGVTLNWQGVRDRSVADQIAEGYAVVEGTELRENYVHNSGDGSYIIRDYDYSSNTATDTLTFTDQASTDVTMVQNAYDLVITTSGGETITIDNYFDTDQDYNIEELVFTDGVTLNWQGVRDRSVADQVAEGYAVVEGTELRENYVHNSGDGSYTIRDYDYSSNTATDTLTFADLDSTDVTVIQNSYDLVITTSGEDVVTIDNYFDTDQDYNIEQISFADGVTLNWQGVRDRSVADQLAEGYAVIEGTELQENYVHSTGDGSYMIRDYDYSSNSATDTFLFTDQDQADVTLAVGATNDLVMTTSGGETITIDNYFDSDMDYAMDQISFADGTTLTWQDVNNMLLV